MPLELRSPEWIALGFFLYLAVAALLMPLPVRRKRRAIARAMLISAFILLMAVPDGVVAVRARDGLPVVYLLLGYWLPAHLVTSTNPKLPHAAHTHGVVPLRHDRNVALAQESANRKKTVPVVS